VIKRWGGLSFEKHYFVVSGALSPEMPVFPFMNNHEELRFRILKSTR